MTHQQHPTFRNRTFHAEIVELIHWTPNAAVVRNPNRPGLGFRYIAPAIFKTEWEQVQS